MAKGFSIKFNDGDFQKLLNNYKKEITQKSAEIDQVIGANAELMATSAKGKCPVDTGRLRASITAKKDQFMTWAIVAQTNYAAYVEFGTGLGFIPVKEKEWNEIAAQFKGNNIRQVNLPARPYMRPSILAYIPELVKDINKVLKK